MPRPGGASPRARGARNSSLPSARRQDVRAAATTSSDRLCTAVCHRIAARSLGPFALKNLRGSFELFALEVAPAHPREVVDPVCRMRLDPTRAAGQLQVAGRDYWFCSLECAAAFLRETVER